MFSMDNETIPSRKDKHGCVFIDRDGERFRVVLNYLRSGSVVCEGDQAALAAVLEEADFFGTSRIKPYS